MNVNIESGGLAWRHNISRHDSVIEMIEVHAQHARNILNVTLYEIECDRNFAAKLGNSTILAPLLGNYVSIVLDVDELSNLQNAKQNRAVLRHWRENATLFLFDPDEFLVFKNPVNDRALLEDVLLNIDDQLTFPRPSTFCTSCANTKTKEIGALSSNIDTWGIDWSEWTAEHFGYRKSAVNPDTVFSCVIHGCWRLYFPPGLGHLNGRTTPVHDVAPYSTKDKFSNFYIAHLSNAYHVRYNVSTSTTYEPFDIQKLFTYATLR